MSSTQDANSDQGESCRPIEVPDDSESKSVVKSITRALQKESEYGNGLPADNFEPEDSESEAYHAAQRGQSQGGQSGA